ncbi:MAG: response regulator [Candidatus Eremiobacteraeota bacterium]|nr:response regulator [Candidatus Eremiobacteraeota bacterium]
MCEIRRVLLVEDNPADIDLIRELLAETGSFRIDSATRLSEALARLGAEKFDLVLLDLGLPDSMGLESFHRMKEAEPGIPIVVMTGNDNQELAVTAVKEGAQDYLVKGRVTGNQLARSILYALERKRAQARERLAREVLELLNRTEGASEIIRSILLLFNKSMDFEAIGIRLREGDDFPYFETKGFPEDFIEAERYLCGRDEAGEIMRDAQGDPVLECMCGNILRGRTDASLPFFTRGGSFYSNCTTDLLASTTEKERQSRTRNRCNGEGYESVALIPLRSGTEIIGLLQFNDRRRNRFTAEMIHFFEGLGASIGIALMHKQTVEKLRESEARYHTLFETIADGILIADNEERKFMYANKSICRMLGYTEEKLKTLGLGDIHPKDALPSVMLEFEALVRGDKTLNSDIPCIRKDGTIFYADVNSAQLTFDGLGCTMGIFRDVTERRQAEDARDKLETQLSQAQKMESVGQLAGGVAHDFNNILQSMMGYSQLLLECLPAGDESHEFAQEILHDTDRAAALIRQLLAFASKQTIAPKIIDLNDAVEGILKMLRRLIGEDINLIWKPAPNLWPVKMDPAQIDQILTNLTINARDAIGGIGRISIKTGSTELDEACCDTQPLFAPGRYVVLEVNDDGCGMDKEIMAHVFEPFFTTKEMGKGTGLGLATVYGIVKQNHGFIDLESEPGKGTTFRICLPRHEPENAVTGERLPSVEAPTGTETVLIVEDQESLLKLIRRLLEQLGYHVLAAGSPNNALKLAEEYPDLIHLLLTDVVMPEMNGRDLMKRLTAMRPGIKCLFMSGYTSDVIARRGVLEADVHFLQKPFSVKSLARKVHEVLSGQ